MNLKSRIFKKSNLWHLGAIVLFLTVASIFFYPALKGYTVIQGDVTKWVGASQEIRDFREMEGETGWTNSMFSGMPTNQISLIYEGRGAMGFLKDAMSLWMPNPISVVFLYFLGFYILALSLRIKPIIGMAMALAFGLSSSQIIILEAGHVTKAYAIAFAPMVLAGIFFAYRWKNWILGVGLAGLFMTFELMSNHVQITYYMSFVILAVGIAELIRYLREDKKISHFLKATGGLLLAFGCAFLINSGNLIGTQEYGKYTTRGGTELTITASGESNSDIATSGLDREYITNWSYGKAETFSFIVPNFKGGETGALGNNDANKDILKEVNNAARQDVAGQNQYWGDQPFVSGPVYIGIIVFFLAILGLVYSKDRMKWALLIVTILTVMLSWGKNFMFLTDLFIDYLPGYNKFRAVTIILAVAQLCVPLLGVLFLHRLYNAREEIKENMIPFFATTGVFALVLLVFLIAPSATNSFLSEAENAQIDSLLMSAEGNMAMADRVTTIFGELENARIALFRKDVLRSFGFFIVAVAILMLFIRGVLKGVAFVSILGVLMLLDMGMVSKRYLNTEKKGRNFVQWEEVWKQKYPYLAGNGDLEILKRETQLNLELKAEIDQGVAEMTKSFSKDMKAAEKQLMKDWITFRILNRKTNYRVFDLANPFNSAHASYFHKSAGGYHGAKLGRYQELIEFHLGAQNPSVMDMLNIKYQVAAQASAAGMTNAFVKENTTAMGNAWFSKSIKEVASADEEIVSMASSGRATLTPTDSLFTILLNGQPITGEVAVSEQDLVQFVYVLASDLGARRDTVDQYIPVRESEGNVLALIPGQEPMTWNWAYDAMVGDNFSKVMILSGNGRNGWDPREETIVASNYAKNITQSSYSGNGQIVMTAYHPDKLTYQSSSSDKQLAVFSEIYYPAGWKAYVDNNEVPISKVNYLLRAIEVPAGDHTIEFVYSSESYKQSAIYAYIGTILIFLLLIGGIWMGTKNKEAEDTVGVE